MSDQTEIQLPSSTIAESLTDTVTCRLCRRQFAKYTCPTCNVPYCSLTCFRSQAHNQCSEGFYKKEIENDIHAWPPKTAQERQPMMELLKKFEDTASRQEPFADGNDEEDEDDPSDLVARLGEVNIDSTSPDELWAMLTREEREKFMKVLEDPSSELAQQLLSSEQLEKEIRGPWWEAPAIDVEGEEEESRQGLNHQITQQYGSQPIMMTIPASEVKSIPFGHPLGYNMCAICITYAYITRHLGTSPLSSLKPDDPEIHEARRLMSRMVHFLTDRKSTKLYPNLSAVITDIWSTFDMDQITSDLFALLLQDAGRLLAPLRVTRVAPAMHDVAPSQEMVSISHPHIMPVLVLSDLHDLLSNPSRLEPTQSNQVKSKGNHVAHKLRFYAVHILSTPSVILEALAREMMARAERYRGQASILESTQGEVKRRSEPKKLVEEIEAPS